MTFTSTNVIAALALRPTMGESVEFMLSGFFVVMAVLIAMYVFMKVQGAAFTSASSKKNANAASARPAVPAATPAAPSAPAAADSHLVAVIAAAAHAVLGSRVRIVSVRPSSGEWSAEGRRQIFASKRVR